MELHEGIEQCEPCDKNLSERAAVEHVSPHRLYHSNYNIRDMLMGAQMNLLGGGHRLIVRGFGLDCVRRELTITSGGKAESAPQHSRIP